MEEPLRAYARKRREDTGEPPELHPATRRMLQAEVTKLRPREKPGGHGAWSWFFLRWPRVAFAAGVFVVLGVVVWNSLPEKYRASGFSLAKQNTSPATQPSRSEAVKEDALGRSDALGDESSLAIAQGGVGATTPADPKLNEPALSKKVRSTRAPSKALADAESAVMERQVRLQAEPAPALDAFHADGLAGARYAKANTNTATLGLPLKPSPNTQENEMLAWSVKNSAAPNDLADRTDAAGTRLYTLPPAARDARPMTRAGGAPTAAGAQPAEPATSKPAATTVEARAKEIAPEVAFRGSKDAAPLTRKDAAPPPPGIAPVTLAPQPAPALRPSSLPGAAPAAPAAAAPVVEELTVAGPAATRYVRFARTETAEFDAAKKEKTAVNSTVLSTFGFEQRGDSVRIIDADGSVYAGRVLSVAEAEQVRFGEVTANTRVVPPPDASRRRLAVDALKDESLAARETRLPTNMVFRVTGTNRSLGQLVTLEAGFSGGTGEAASREWFRAAPPQEAKLQAVAEYFFQAAPTGPGTSAALGRLVGRFRMGASDQSGIIAAPAVK